MLCSAGEAVLELLLPKAMSQIVDVGIANGDKAYILATGLKMILMALASLVMGVGAAALAAKAGMGFGANVRSRGICPGAEVLLCQHRAVFHRVPDHPAHKRRLVGADDPDDGHADAGPGPGDADHRPGHGP